MWVVVSFWSFEAGLWFLDFEAHGFRPWHGSAVGEVCVGSIFDLRLRLLRQGCFSILCCRSFLLMHLDITAGRPIVFSFVALASIPTPLASIQGL